MKKKTKRKYIPTGRPEGRPTSYDPKYNEEVEKLIGIGLQMTDVAHFLNVDVKTLYNWRDKDKEFFQAIERGRAKGKTTVVNKLFQKINEGNLTAIIFWLCNRYPQEWSNVNRVEQTARLDINAKVEQKKVSLELFSVINQVGVEKAKEILEGSKKELTGGSREPAEKGKEVVVSSEQSGKE